MNGATKLDIKKNKEKKMTNETKMLATMILEIVKTAKNWVCKPSIKTKDLIDEYIESNKTYEIETDSDGDTRKIFVGIKNEEMDKIFKHLMTSIERDEKDLNRYDSEVSQKGDSQLRLIETLVRHYADVSTDE